MADLQPDNAATGEAHVPWETLDGAGEVAGLQDADPIDVEGVEPFDTEASEPAVPAPAASVMTSSITPTDSDPDILFEEPPRASGGWTITVLCAGLALLGCAILIPQADANRRIAYERQTLRNDLENVEKQISVNQEFIHQVGQDPTLAERLARRQMKVIPAGNKIIDIPDQPDAAMSPFQLTNIGRPAPLPAYKPIGGFIANICYSSHARLYLIGIALGMVATGLVLGGSSRD